ncbi:hypothetical protein T069G_05144 [Trichoderma breve]|uniref:NACHT domain-containing protein n=1 Tax=Trichoderma breve TaxID=2034170 RepID=A0A9W9BII1_9HYPO|nr:hypothetical protein T069G_05144 [Trichoderma breve]KAJ4860156.1 hypothetical protein T069G_05144 [Trichoderma breve]
MPFKTGPVSLPGRRIIREAFEELQRTVSPLEAKDFQNTTLEDVEKAALDIENQLAAKKMLRNMRRLKPLFQGLGHYSQSIEVLCNGTPYLPWIWAPIKLILTIASDFVEALERIVAAYSQIAESLPRVEMLGEAFGKRIEFQEILAVFYSDILKFHRHAYMFVRRSSWKIFFLTTWGRFQRRLDTILTNMKAHEELIDKTANAVNILEASKMRESLRNQINENIDEVAKQEDEDSTKQYQAIIGWLKMDDTDQQVIFDSIASEAEKNEGTCDWIFKQPTLVSWMRTQPETPFLWLQGNPGAGKSVLATQIDVFLRTSHQSLVVRHFCTYSYASSIQFDQILRSLLLQLIRSNGDLITYIYEKFVLAKQAVTIKSLSQLIRGPNSSMFYKVLISSRPSPLLSKKFRKRPTVSLIDEKSRINEAIKIYAHQKLGFLRNRFLEFGICGTDIAELSRSISLKADGMFLWARLVLEYISSNIFYSRDEVLCSVNMLPRKLSEFQGDIEAPMMPPQYIFEMCTPLIQENKDRTLSFIHVSVKDHLKSAETAMALVEADALCEHGVAAITCLLAGFRIFDTTYDSSDRNLRILRGLHAFHIYATDYWLEDLLCSNAAICGFEAASLLYSTAKALADRLNTESLSTKISEISAEQESGTLDSRLEKFANQGAVYDMLRLALRERSTRASSSQSQQDDHSTDLIQLALQNLQDLLASYQASIRSLLMIPSFPGITFEELEKFKRNFRTAAFTCRVRNCPRATTGFPDEKKLSEHERTHTQRIMCAVPDCQYPPLTSSRALNVHMSKCHGKIQRIANITRISTQRATVSGRLHRADNTDVVTQRKRHASSPPAEAESQSTQQSTQDLKQNVPNFTSLTPEQEATLTPAQSVRYKEILKNHGTVTVTAAPTEANSESLNRLKLIGQEEQRQFNQEHMEDIPMSPEEYTEAAQKVKRLVSDISKVGRRVREWYDITQDDARAKMFFNYRLRLIKQHVDGEQMTVMKDVFSIRSSDLDQCRALLETMAKELAASVIDKHMMNPGAKGISQQVLQELKQLSLQQQQQRQAQQAGRMAP